MRAFPLSDLKAGITRLRTKGGANPEGLFNLKDAYITAARTVRPRQGTRWEYAPPAGTRGLMQFRGKLYVFAATTIVMTDPRFLCAVVRHPTNAAATLEKIHYAAPFMGSPYVVAQFSDGLIKHYWLQEAASWAGTATYKFGQMVQPTVPNGYSYIARRAGSPNPTWKPDVKRAVGDKVEPTVFNGFYYEVTSVGGAVPRSGKIEPDWPVQKGTIVIEDTDTPTDQSSTDTGTTPDPGAPPPGGGPGGGDTTLPGDTQDRYSTDRDNNNVRFNIQ